MRLSLILGVGAGGASLVAMALQACAQPASRADARRGAQLFAAQCGLCHATTGRMGAGPPLGGVAGRKAASVGGFGYSAALRRTGWTWDDAHLDRFLTDPPRAVPGTAMPVAVPNPKDRRDLIAYLHQLKNVRTAADSGPRQEPRLSASKTGGPYGDWRGDAPGRVHRITVADLPAPFASESAGAGAQRVARPAGVMPKAPPGVHVAVFATGLHNPRRLATAPNGDLFVAETGAGQVRVLRPTADGSTASQSSVYANGLEGPFGMAFYPAGPAPQWLYVAEENRVLRFPYRPGDLRARGKPEVVVAQLAATTGGHTSRDLAFTPDGRLLISVGSQSNVAEGIGRRPLPAAQAFEREAGAVGAAWGAEANRADVLVTSPGGGRPRVFATGLRNCVGLAVQPGSGAIWCAVNERDGLGDDLPPDYVTRVREGGFYGWPWWYIGDHEEPRLKGARPDLRGKAITPDVLIQPHSAPMTLAFYAGRMFPEWRGSALVVLHGSWNRARRTGYKVVRVLTDGAGRPTGAYDDVLTGFVAGDRAVWGRPVGVAVAADGSLLVSDDAGGVIWRLAK